MNLEELLHKAREVQQNLINYCDQMSVYNTICEDICKINLKNIIFIPSLVSKTKKKDNVITININTNDMDIETSIIQELYNATVIDKLNDFDNNLNKDITKIISNDYDFRDIINLILTYARSIEYLELGGQIVCMYYNKLYYNRSTDINDIVGIVLNDINENIDYYYSVMKIPISVAEFKDKIEKGKVRELNIYIQN
jgi:hypothetical protein